MIQYKKGISYPLFIVLTALLISCNPYRKLNILQEPKDSKDSINYNQIQQFHILQPGDLLNIRIFENSVDISKTFVGLNDNNIGNINSDAAVFISGYPVLADGTINHPSIGEFKVGGLTVNQARELLQKKFNDITTGVTVSLMLVNYRFTVLGEVYSPGLYTSYNEQINLLEALGRAGGFSEFANSTRVKIIRKSKDGKSSSMIRLDLSKDKILNSNYFYIQPNDVIYVEPLKSKSFNLTYKQISPLISSISAAVSILNLSILIYQNSKK
jgi:polysaccharide export outer membrane protein